MKRESQANRNGSIAPVKFEMLDHVGEGRKREKTAFM
jgi:hypothetical protein